MKCERINTTCYVTFPYVVIHRFCTIYMETTRYSFPENSFLSEVVNLEIYDCNEP
jgi:hypothetical protein